MWTVAGVLGAAAPAAADPAVALATRTSPTPAIVQVHLQHLRLDLQLDWAGRQAVGIATLDLRATGPVRQVPLRAQELHITTVQDANGRTLPHRQALTPDASSTPQAHAATAGPTPATG